MSKYNYFDDPNEEVNKKTRSKERTEDPSIDLSAALKDFSKRRGDKVTRSSVSLKNIPVKNASEIVETIKEISPAKRRFIRFIAFIMFLIVVALCIFIFVATINSENKKNDLFNSQAAGVCSSYAGKYGNCSFTRVDSASKKTLYRITGLCYAREMDFNDDGTSELMLCYYNGGEYHLEIWAYNKKDTLEMIYTTASNVDKKKKYGTWLTFYRHSNKYYIATNNGKASDDGSLTLFKMKGNGFESVKTECKYDAKNNIYTVNGDIEAYSFETLKLSFIPIDTVENIMDTVNSNIDNFGSSEVNSNKLTMNEEERMKNAYYTLVNQYNTNYGVAKFETKDGYSFISGLAAVNLVDFDKNGTDELVLVYRNTKSTRSEDSQGNYISRSRSIYNIDIYKWNGTMATRVYSNEGISCNKDDYDTMYYMFKYDNGKIYYCANIFEYIRGEYASESKTNASSRQYEFDGARFEPVYRAYYTTQYGYTKYYINGSRIYDKSTFDQQGYDLPMFNGTNIYDNDSYTVNYLQRKTDAASTLKNVPGATEEQIRKLNPSYDASLF